MKTSYIIILTIAAILLIIMVIAMFTRKTKRLKIAIIIMLLDLCLCGYVAYDYIKEEPILTLNGNQIVQLEVNEPYKELGITATYHQKDVSKDVAIIGEVNVEKVGTYQVFYQYTYHKDKVKELQRTVKVEDHVAPRIELKGRAEMTLYENEKYEEPGYVVEDNVDDNLEKEVKVEKKVINSKEYHLVYKVKDKSGNEAEAIRKICLKEIEKKPEATKPPTASNNGVIYLTFDDGPSLTTTPKILDILKEEGVKATFFILNYNKNQEVLVKRIVNEGHSIGIHGYSHDYKKIYQSVDSYMENIKKLQEKIKKSTGVTTNLTRFPGGSSNTISSFNPKIMTKLTKEIVKKGYRYYDWNVSSGDAGEAKNRDEVYQNVIKDLYRNGNNVVLMHDFSGNQKTVDALRAIIQYGKRNGYTFEAITENTPMVTHRINN